jgi:HlyD family secretion protein
MEIQTSVDEADISKVQVGQPVTFTVDAYSNQTFPGTVAQIRKAPILTQNVVTYIVIVSVENKDLKLMPGMTADVTIEAVRLRDVLKVPSASLRFKPETEGAGAGARSAERVYALRAGAPVPIPVKTGITGDGYVEVVSSEGLLENDEVIIEQLVEKKSAPKAAGPGPGL